MVLVLVIKYIARVSIKYSSIRNLKVGTFIVLKEIDYFTVTIKLL